MPELVREARERILVDLAELLDVEVGGLTRAGHPHTNEAGLVVGEHHPVLHTGTLGFPLRAAGPSADAVAVHGEGPSKAGAPSEALPQARAAGKPLAPAIPGEPHRRPGRASPVPVRVGGA